jgi:hypothetical protein
MSTTIADFREAEGDLYGASDADTTDVDDSGGGGLASTIGAVLDPTRGADPTTEAIIRANPLTIGPAALADLSGEVTNNQRDATIVESTLLERPGEWLFIEEGSDSVDLPGGSLRDPLNLNGGPEGPTGGAGSGDNTPATNLADQVATAIQQVLASIPWTVIGVGLVIFTALMVAVNAFAGGLAEGVTE